METRGGCSRSERAMARVADSICACVRSEESGMTIRLHLQIVGALLVVLGAAHRLFGRYFGWKKELERVSLLTRQVFAVHCFFIALLLMLLGACSLFYAD